MTLLWAVIGTGLLVAGAYAAVGAIIIWAIKVSKDFGL